MFRLFNVCGSGFRKPGALREKPLKYAPQTMYAALVTRQGRGAVLLVLGFEGQGAVLLVLGFEVEGLGFWYLEDLALIEEGLVV